MSDDFESAAQHSVHPTGGSLRVFKQFAWLGVGSGKVALPRPAHQRVTQAVGQQDRDVKCKRNTSKETIDDDRIGKPVRKST